MSTRPVLCRASKVKVEAMPADYDPDQEPEMEYTPLTRKRGAGNNVSTVSEPKKARRHQEPEGPIGRQPQNPTCVPPSVDDFEPEILAGNHLCVIDGCGEEVEDDGTDLGTHYASHYLEEGVRASLFAHPVLGHLLVDDLDTLQETYDNILNSTVKKYRLVEILGLCFCSSCPI